MDDLWGGGLSRRFFLAENRRQKFIFVAHFCRTF
jgi:hypothetical protein